MTITNPQKEYMGSHQRLPVLKPCTPQTELHGLDHKAVKIAFIIICQQHEAVYRYRGTWSGRRTDPGSVFTNDSSEHCFSLQDLSYLKET